MNFWEMYNFRHYSPDAAAGTTGGTDASAGSGSDGSPDASDGVAGDQTAEGGETAPPAGKTATGDPDGKSGELSPELQKVIQSAVDRATNKLGNQLKAAKADNDKLRKAQMTDEQAREYDRQEKEKALSEKEAEINAKENRFFALSEVTKLGYTGDDAAALVDFVMADDQDTITQRISTVKSLIDRLVTAQVDAKFKSAGTTPKGSKQQTGSGTPSSVAVQIGEANKARDKRSTDILASYGIIKNQ